MGIAVQTAVGELGSKAVSELSFAFGGMVDCGKFQYGVNESGIFLLNSGETDGGVRFTSSFTLATSDFGIVNNKRFRYIYITLEVFGDTEITLEVRPNGGEWLSRTVSVSGPGLKTVRASIRREGGKGNYHTVRLSSDRQFRIHGISGLFTVLAMGIKGV